MPCVCVCVRVALRLQSTHTYACEALRGQLALCEHGALVCLCMAAVMALQAGALVPCIEPQQACAYARCFLPAADAAASFGAACSTCQEARARGQAAGFQVAANGWPAIADQGDVPGTGPTRHPAQRCEAMAMVMPDIASLGGCVAWPRHVHVLVTGYGAQSEAPTHELLVQCMQQACNTSGLVQPEAEAEGTGGVTAAGCVVISSDAGLQGRGGAGACSPVRMDALRAGPEPGYASLLAGAVKVTIARPGMCVLLS